MTNGRLHAIVTVALALGVAYLGFNRYAGTDRLQGPDRARSRYEKAGAETQERGRVESGQPREAQPDSGAVSAAVLSQALSAIAAREPQPSEPTVAGPLAQARATLDERLVSAPASPAEVARLEGTIRPLLVPSVLGEAVAELRCSATMCRVNLIGEDDSRIDRAVNAFAEHLPKAFSSVLMYPDGAGHKSIYLGTRAGDLKLNSEPDPPFKVVDRNTAEPL